MTQNTPEPRGTLDDAPARRAAVRSFVASLDARLRDRPRPTQLPDLTNDVVRQLEAGPDTIAKFMSAATDAGCHVRIAALSELEREITAVARERGIRAAYVALSPPRSTSATEALRALLQFSEAGLRAANVSVTNDWSDESLFSVDASVTLADVGIAETGSIVCTSGPRLPRGVSLIPPTHIALLPASCIVADLVDYFATIDDADLPANLNLITGPSKTADIEGILVTGVHGPGAVEIVIVNPDQESR